LFPVSIYAKLPSLGAETIHPNNMASFLVGLMFVPLGWAVAPPLAQERLGRIHGILRNRWLWAIAVLLMVGALVLTQSRGGYLAAGAGIVVFLLCMSRHRFLWPLAAVVLAVGVVVVLHERSLWMTALAPEGLDTESLAFRWRVWRYALFLVGDFPFTGVGMGAFNDAALALYGFDGFRQPGAHSLFLQVALDVGLPGLIALLVTLGAVLAGAVRAFATFKRLGDALLWPLTSGAIAGLSAILAHGLIDLAAWGTRGSFLLWCLVGLLACLGVLADGSEQTESAAVS
jgi:putative inorganic carbon (HCO3(-)) transporter